MLRSIADYDYVLQHRPGKEMVLPDALSRLSGADWSEVTDGQTGILQRETEADEVMRELMTLVRTSWPLNHKSLDPRLQAYWGVQGDILIVDGLLMAGFALSFQRHHGPRC